VVLNHGGTEMGQGLFIKVAQVVAEVFAIDLDHVRVSATSTAKVPNTSPTAASSGSDLNGMAALHASEQIKARMTEVAAEHFAVPAHEIVFSSNRIYAGNRSLSFAELAALSWEKRVSLSAAGYYRTPKIHWDFATNTGRPFYYFAYGAAAAEVVTAITLVLYVAVNELLVRPKRRRLLTEANGKPTLVARFDRPDAEE
jgi:xanthine dehydrogenase large subunit